MRRFFNLLLITSSFFLSVSVAQSESFKLTCTLIKGNSGAERGVSETYIVDKTRKQLKSDCEDCPWDRTLFWGNYIVFVNSEENMGMLERFYQSSLKILQLKSMVMYSVFINDDTFMFLDIFRNDETVLDDQFAPIFSVKQCRRGF